MCSIQGGDTCFSILMKCPDYHQSRVAQTRKKYAARGVSAQTTVYEVFIFRVYFFLTGSFIPGIYFCRILFSWNAYFCFRCTEALRNVSGKTRIRGFLPTYFSAIFRDWAKLSVGMQPMLRA